MRWVGFASLFIALSPWAAADTGTCVGEERWAVKTLKDSDETKIQFTPMPTTIANLVGLKRPGEVDDKLPRTTGTEMTEFKVSAFLTLYKQETDQDYHLVLEDNPDSENGHTMIAEIPDPDCAQGSPVLDQIKQARQTFERRFMVSADKHATKIPVVVTGIGFFDIAHGGSGQIGHAENNIEIHPVLSIEFTGPASPEFEPTATTTTASAAAELRKEVYEPGTGMMWWVICVVMMLFYIFAIQQTVSTLRKSHDWSLARALQEPDGKPSSSRMIAFLGLLILMVLYMGIGYVAIWRLLNNLALPNVNGFLLTGLSLFAPYAFNQLKEIAVGMGSGRTGPAGAGPRSTPRVIGVTPSSVSGNTSVQITVTGVGFDPRARVLVTTEAAPVTPSACAISDTQIQFSVTMPPSPTPYNAVVRIVNPDLGEATGGFQVC